MDNDVATYYIIDDQKNMSGILQNLLFFPHVDLTYFIGGLFLTCTVHCFSTHFYADLIREKDYGYLFSESLKFTKRLGNVSNILSRPRSENTPSSF
jgi:hypothetical protein